MNYEFQQEYKDDVYSDDIHQLKEKVYDTLAILALAQITDQPLEIIAHNICTVYSSMHLLQHYNTCDSITSKNSYEMQEK